MVASDGGIFTFGDATYQGSGVGRLGAGRDAAAIAPSPSGRGYRILAVPAVVHLGFAGDVHGVGRVATFLSEGGDPLAGMRPDLAANQINLVNLETAVGYSGQAENKQFTFLSPPVLLARLRSAGVSVVNLANNHSLDFGPSALLQTIAYAHAAGLQVIGAGANQAQAYAPVIVDTPGGRVAFLGLSQVVPAGWAATATSPGVASAYDIGAAVAAVQAARREAGYVVVMVHAGVELDQCPTPLQLGLTATLVNAGANVVVGAHPHVLQGLTKVGSAVVDYSLGNFVFYDSSPATDPTGLLDVTLRPGQSDYQFLPAMIDGNGSPQPLYGPAADAVRAEVASLAPGAGRC
jgi:poly-gamma-glutamate synthesis protein (capsule biosynthesis protein)